VSRGLAAIAISLSSVSAMGKPVISPMFDPILPICERLPLSAPDRAWSNSNAKLVLAFI
jgi:hypothetical protein